jgi:hypothetical protein
MIWTRNIHAYLTLAAALSLAACATPEPERVPVELIGSYDEAPAHERRPTANTGGEPSEVSDECRELRKSIENWETAYTASIGLGALGFATGVAGLLLDNEEAQKIGGALGSLGMLSQATTATGAEIQKDKAVERDCLLDE